MARPEAVQGNRPFFTLMPCALRLGLVFGQAYPSYFGIGVGYAGDHSGVKRGCGQIFVALLLACYHFGRYMRFVHGFVGQHGLAYDVADGEDVGHVGAHLDIDVDEAAVCDGYAGFVSRDFFAVGGAAYGLQDQVVGLGGGGRNACVASCVALLCGCEGDFNAYR